MNNLSYRIIFSYLKKKADDLGFNKFVRNREFLKNLDNFADTNGPSSGLAGRIDQIEEKPRAMNWDDPQDILDKLKSKELKPSEVREDAIRLCKEDPRYVRAFVREGVLDGTETGEYDGWANYATANVVFHMSKDENLIQTIRLLVLREQGTYDNLLDKANLWRKKTPDGVSWDVDGLDEAAIEEEMKQL